MKPFLAAIRFLTILPLPGAWATAEADLAGSVAFFPVVGLLLGAAAAALAWALGQVFPPLAASALLVVALLAFSGGLHMDGLSDSADGLFSSRSRERVLEIMRDSRVGAMGVLGIACVLLVKFAGLASLGKPNLLQAAFLAPLAGRCAMVVQITLLPYLRANGLGAVFCRSRPYGAAVWSVAVLVMAGWLVLGKIGLLVALLSLAMTLALAAWFYRRIGGATGDTFGATCEIVELAPVLVLAACGKGGGV